MFVLLVKTVAICCLAVAGLKYIIQNTVQIYNNKSKLVENSIANLLIVVIDIAITYMILCIK